MRGSGSANKTGGDDIRINTFHYQKEDVDCKLCTQYVSKSKPCRALGCPWLAERIEAGAVTYATAVCTAFQNTPLLLPRIYILFRDGGPRIWNDEKHQWRMEQVTIRQGYSKKRDSHAYYAALYLLTSSAELYQRTDLCFTKRGIDFTRASLPGISQDSYALFHLAQQLYSPTGEAYLFDIADPDMVNDRVFSLFLTGFLVARYGPDALKLSL